MGRSHADFVLPGAYAGEVLMRAAAFGAANGFSGAPAPANSVAIVGPPSAMHGTPWILVTGWDLPDGAHVRVEAWIALHGLAGTREFNVNPEAFVGGWSRREAWWRVSDVLRALGLPADWTKFRHG